MCEIKLKHEGVQTVVSESSLLLQRHHKDWSAHLVYRGIHKETRLFQAAMVRELFQGEVQNDVLQD